MSFLITKAPLRALLGVFVFALAGTDARAQEAATSREYALKAAFLFHFTRFVDWPDSAFTNDLQPFVIGVLGDDPFGKTLDDIVAKEAVGDRRIEVHRWETLPPEARCQILFLSGKDLKDATKTLESVRGRSTLTVGDDEKLPDHGGMIGFAVRDNRIRLRINAKAAGNAGLSISSKLLRQAESEGAH